MPRLKKRTPGKAEWYSEAWTEFLATGRGRLRFGRPWKNPIADQELLSCWTIRREDFLANWIRLHPFSRPWIWWTLEAVEPRRKIGGGGSRERGEDRYVQIMTPPGTGRWFVNETEDSPIFESEEDYLDRTGSLTEEERQARRTIEC